MTKAYKKCLDETKTKFVLVELEIPETATYFTPTYMYSPVYKIDGTKLYGQKNEPPKTRCSEAKVIKIHGGGEKAISMAQFDFEYKVGETVKPDKFDPLSDKVCSNGIHCFFNKEDAIKYYTGGMVVSKNSKCNGLIDLPTSSWCAVFKDQGYNVIEITDAIVDKQTTEEVVTE